MPRSHPNVFSYARPKYYKGRGFRGLGDGNAVSCNVFNTPGCSFSDIFSESNQCATALQQCMNPGTALTVPLPPGAGPAPASALTNPSDVYTVYADQSASGTAALTADLATVAGANTCPSGTVALSDGSCGVPGALPSWALWALAAAAILLVVVK